VAMDTYFNAYFSSIRTVVVR